RVARPGRLQYRLHLLAADSRLTHADGPDHPPVDDVEVLRPREPRELDARLGELGAVAVKVVGPVRLRALAERKLRGIAHCMLGVAVFERALPAARTRVREIPPARPRAARRAQIEPGRAGHGGCGPNR